MPRIAIDYSKALVYRIAYKDTTYYIGSTTNFTRRKCQHKNNCKNENTENYNKPLYVFIRENGGWSDEWVMVLVQSYPNCKTSIELLKYEREHYDIYKPELNVYRPCLKDGEEKERQKEYTKENADKIKEYKKENADRIKEYEKEYRKENADRIKEYEKEYRKENADKIKEYKKEYRKENADKIKVYQKENTDKSKEKHTCECGGKYTTCHLSLHKKTKKHIKFIESQKNKLLT